MTFFQILYSVLIRPLQIFFEYVYSVAQKGLQNPGLSIIALSLAMNLLVLPLYNRADKVQEEERDTENRLRKGVSHIKKTFKGDEKMMMLQTYYRQNGYKPTDVFKGSISLLLEIPFFIAAYQFLSNLPIIKGVQFGPIMDLGAQDALITIGAFSINLLPIIMTTVNLISCIIFTKGYPLKTKIQLYGMAIFFFFFLYKSPSGLVFYWTLNNIFSLGKTIYYKSKTARKVMNILFAAMGAGLIAGIPFALKRTGSKSFLLIMAAFACICFVPLLVSVIKKKKQTKERKEILKLQSSRLLFTIGGIYMSVLVGILIPSAVLKSSPQEFVDIYNYLNPLWFVVSAACIATGLFVVWFGVFYSLANEKIKRIFNLAMGVLCTVATVDYMFFGKNRSLLNSSLAYNEVFTVPLKTIAINILVIIAVGAATAVIINFVGKKASFAFIAGVIAIFGMSIVNCVGISGSIGQIKDSIASTGSGKPQFNLSKNGKNVIGFMPDRAMNEYLPYFINERPEIVDMYDGFCYYPNTVSFGMCTNYGAPALFGGYEYTPEEINKRDTELLQVKHDEALKVMPVIFDQNGYDVTVCDPPFAGYNYVPDLSIYDDYPDINAYIARGYFWNAEKESVSRRNFRNFFCYAIMKTAPLALQNHFYNLGMYNESVDNSGVDASITEAKGQFRTGLMQAEGIDEELMWDWSTLTHLNDMTNIVDDDSNNFLMIDNEVTHRAVYFQEPEYEAAYYINNEEYEAEHSDRYTWNGITLEMTTDVHYAEYQSNMAAILKIGAWLDYLKEQGVYDNTRIIIVADHGRPVQQNEIYLLDDGADAYKDIENYYPMLLVKDFNSKGFTVDEQFMTNADTPTLAMEGLIDNPVNPFTGKAINNDEKFAHPQKVLGAFAPDIETNNGTKYIEEIWFSVEKDMRDKNNWTVIEDLR
jgi:YidC/Oxa1 family membrane protein insertase